MQALGEYGIEKWERRTPRVYLAALKLANGNLEKLKDEIKIAKRDYRDVLAAAQNPVYFGAGYGASELPVKEQKRIIDSDRKQYEEWLRR